MEDPIRLRNSANLSSHARSLLESMSPTPSMPADVGTELVPQIDRIAAMPVASSGAIVWLALLAVVGLGVALWATTWFPETRALAPGPAMATPRSPRQVRLVEIRAAADEVQPYTAGSVGVQNIASKPTSALAAPLPTASEVNEPGGLAEELRILDDARKRLATAPDAALTRVQEHRRRFPRGQLADLRDFVEIQVYLRRGAQARVRSLSDGFFATHPQSALAEELRRSLAHGDDQ